MNTRTESDRPQEHRLKNIAAEAARVVLDRVHLAERSPLDIQSNRLYNARTGRRHLILKEYLKADEFEDAPVREYNALRLISYLDIAPQPLAYHPHDADGRPVVVCEYMPGDMWDRNRPAQAELKNLAEIWIKLNKVPSNGLWLSRGQETSIEDIWEGVLLLYQRYEKWMEVEFRPARSALDLCFRLLDGRRSIVQELSGFVFPLDFCRADPRFANVIRQPDGRLGLVDWEDSGLRDPARDLADIMTHPNQEDLLSPSQWSAFIDPYLNYRRRLDDKIVRRTHLYMGLFPLWWLGILINEGVRMMVSGRFSEWRIHGMHPNEKLRRYLARAQAWPNQNFDQELPSLAASRFFPDRVHSTS